MSHSMSDVPDIKLFVSVFVGHIRVPTPHSEGTHSLQKGIWKYPAQEPLRFNVTWIFLGIYQWKSLLEMWISISIQTYDTFTFDLVHMNTQFYI